uniref:Secreted protein n=1 Tax=Mesocestoides corti TaxID=53468 RepID=A0A5K3EQC6_MESCO
MSARCVLLPFFLIPNQQLPTAPMVVFQRQYSKFSQPFLYSVAKCDRAAQAGNARSARKLSDSTRVQMSSSGDEKVGHIGRPANCALANPPIQWLHKNAII